MPTRQVHNSFNGLHTVTLHTSSRFRVYIYSHLTITIYISTFLVTNFNPRSLFTEIITKVLTVGIYSLVVVSEIVHFQMVVSVEVEDVHVGICHCFQGCVITDGAHYILMTRYAPIPCILTNKVPQLVTKTFTGKLPNVSPTVY